MDPLRIGAVILIQVNATEKTWVTIIDVLPNNRFRGALFLYPLTKDNILTFGESDIIDIDL
ncbi:hypothetical protein [Enterococcus sp. LJL51]|uniref:hypothetical protein n=1 Tax=Enterococcus sp. LJL51 TaxID=3416656 RepID=UPI003CE7AEB9